MHNSRGRRCIGPHQYGQSAYRSDHILGGIRVEERHHYDFARKFVGVVRVLDHHFGNDANERAYDGLCDDTLDARDIKAQREKVQGEDALMVSCQNKVDNAPSRQGVGMCFYCGNLGHIARFCHKAKNKEMDNAKNVKDKDEFTFASQHKAYLRNVCECQ